MSYLCHSISSHGGRSLDGRLGPRQHHHTSLLKTAKSRLVYRWSAVVGIYNVIFAQHPFKKLYKTTIMLLTLRLSTLFLAHQANALKCSFIGCFCCCNPIVCNLYLEVGAGKAGRDRGRPHARLPH